MYLHTKFFFLLLISITYVCAASQESQQSETLTKVAVLTFDSVGTKEHLGRGVSELIMAELINSGRYAVVERARLDVILDEQTLQRADMIDGQAAKEIGRLVGAQLIVVGSVILFGDTYTISARCVDVKTGRSLQAKTITADTESVIPKTCALLTRRLFDLPLDPDAELLKQEAVEAIREHCYQELTIIPDKAADIPDMIKAVHNWVQYLDQTTYEFFTKKQKEDEFSGVGTFVMYANNRFYIKKVIEGGPADQSGIVTGDIITTVDGKSIDGLSIKKLVSLIRGPTGTDVTLGIYRPSLKTHRSITITRQRVTMDAPFVETYVHNVLYIRIPVFNDTTHQHIAHSLTQDVTPDSKLILDLRKCHGGFVTAAMHTADLFVSKDVPMLRVLGKDGTVTQTFRSSAAPLYTGPLAVLTDKETSRSAEAFAMVLRAHAKAVIAGERTSGDGIMWTIVPLSDGSALRIASGVFDVPGKGTYNKKGIEPDIKESRWRECYQKAVEYLKDI